MKRLPTVCLLAMLPSLAIAAASESETYTLYRSSATGVEMRVHVGTFDTENGEAYNRENCQLAADLFQTQPGVTVRFWCEKSKFRR